MANFRGAQLAFAHSALIYEHALYNIRVAIREKWNFYCDNRGNAEGFRGHVLQCKLGVICYGKDMLPGGRYCCRVAEFTN